MKTLFALLGVLALLLVGLRQEIFTVGDVLSGVIAGALTSFVVVYWYEFATGPRLTIEDDPNDPQFDPGPPPHRFYHAIVRQVQPGWPFGSRRPAWAARGRLAVYRNDKETVVIPDTFARWAGSPPPVTVTRDGEDGEVPDRSKVGIGSRRDIHFGHPGEQLDVAIEIEGERDWYL